jgi:Fe-S-cluster-containing dehydrogenase component
LSVAGAGTAITVGLFPTTMVMADTNSQRKGKAVLYDATLCTGDCLCELACRQWNKLSNGESFTH